MERMDKARSFDFKRGVESKCIECSKALHVSMQNQRFTVGRQYREPWLDSRDAAPVGMVLKSLFVLCTTIQGVSHVVCTRDNIYCYKHDLDNRENLEC